MTVKPTPIQKLDKISKVCKSNIYCMRDDLTGFAFGGNKNRKLDYLVADAIKKGADTLIAIGSNQSNFCRMTSGAGAVNDLEVNLVLAGKKPEQPTGNLLVNHVFDAVIHHVETDDDEVLLEKAKKLEKELRIKGRNVYNMPSGGSTNIGILGYVEAFSEIIDYEEKTGIHFDYIVHASGSGGTQAGLVAGKTLANTNHKILGFSVGRGEEELKGIVGDLANQVSKLMECKVSEHDVLVDDSYIGERYGAKTGEGEEAITLFAKKEGILLDYVYTGKAAAGLLDYCRKGKFGKDHNILFIHTGGNIELFE
ncbi:MAG: D-cysteine desulfhydrase family protein [Bacteroidota bacterium]